MCLVPERAFSRAPVDIHLVYLCRFVVRAPGGLLRGFSRQRGTLDFRRHEFSSCLSLLMPAGSLVWSSAVLSVCLKTTHNAPLPKTFPKKCHFAASVVCLSPVGLLVHIRLTSELLRFL